MTKKRGNNEGSVFRSSSGRWRGQISLEGHRQSKSFITQRECIDWVRKNRNQIGDGLSYASTQLTLGEYLDGWLTNKKAKRRYATWIHYELLVQRIYHSGSREHEAEGSSGSPCPRTITNLLKSGTGILYNSEDP